jgi:hypothetical protein
MVKFFDAFGKFLLYCNYLSIRALELRVESGSKFAVGEKTKNERPRVHQIRNS